jgi:hypothetical protein
LEKEHGNWFQIGKDKVKDVVAKYCVYTGARIIKEELSKNKNYVEEQVEQVGSVVDLYVGVEEKF